MRCEHSANAWRTICNNVANIRRMRGEWIATMWRHSANTWRTICNNVANIRQIRGERIATMQHSKNKNHTFVTQKPPFCTSKTILLHVKNHTFVMRICNIQKTNTLRTFRECILNGLRMRGEYHEMDCKTLRNIPTYTHEIGCEHSAIYPHTPTKLVANTPQYTHVHPRNWLRTNCGCTANKLPNIADGLP